MPSLVTERIESVKAGIVGAVSFTIAELTIAIAIGWADSIVKEYNFAQTTAIPELLLQLAIGAVSGFLFGVTYRYVIRDDRNFHLNDGAVLAFGLVRGLALIEKNLASNLVPNLVFIELLLPFLLIIQSIVCFAIARSVLDLAIARKLIKPFI